MTFRPVTDLSAPVGEFLHDADSEGLVLETEGRERYAVIPLDDDLLDYFVARSPKFIESCQQIRDRMRAGRFHSHEEVKKLLEAE